jgi:T5SS/PEP-CTERM-associated repeat protein
MKRHRLSTAFLATCLLLVCSQGQAEVIATGDVSPSGATDPWDIYALYVGLTGEGTLNIEAGGVVSNAEGSIGYDGDSVGTATVTGEGSEWNNSKRLHVGYSGNGTLNIESGGLVSSVAGFVGYSSGSGTVTVTGNGSQWNGLGVLRVGYYGGGALNIESGGVVSSRWSSIGLLSGSVGTVTVTGKGSEWNNSSLLNVGRHGKGTLNIKNGGLVHVAGTTTLNNSTLHIELSDPTSGPFLITDGLELAGAFEISLADGFLPELGTTFDILAFNTVSGNFTEVSLPALEGGLEWDTSQLLVDGSLYARASPLEGDFNYDGVIDAADYTVWQDSGGDEIDYLTWKDHFGKTISTGSEGAAAVPEPATLLLALLAMVAAPLRVRCARCVTREKNLCRPPRGQIILASGIP